MRRLLLFTGLMAWLGSSFANPFIGGYDGPAHTYKIERMVEGRPEAIKVAVFENLLPGDKVSARSPRWGLTLTYADGTEVKVTRENSPYVVEDVGEVPDTISNLIYWAKNTLEDFRGEQKFTPVNLITRAGGFNDPQLLIPEEGAQLTTGQSLAVVFKGYADGYQIRLTGPNSRQQVLETSFDNRGTGRASSEVLASGRWQVEFVAEGEVLAANSFTVVKEADRPSLPENLNVEAALTHQVYALWLAQANPGWRSEAYQMLHRQPGEVARQLAWMLEQKIAAAEQ